MFRCIPSLVTKCPILGGPLGRVRLADAASQRALVYAQRHFAPSAAFFRANSRHFRPFSSEDEAQLTAVLSTKPRHVARHIRQSMLSSRRRITQFRNSVTYLMILLQSQLQRKQIKPEDATQIMESLMKECVELRQSDMSHLLFRAAVRFRKYGLSVRFPLVKYLFESYRLDNAKELMKNMADELRNDKKLQFIAVLAYEFSGHDTAAKELLAEIPRDLYNTEDICGLVETYGMTAHFDDIVALLQLLFESHSSGSGESTLDKSAVYSTAVIALRGSTDLMDLVIDTTIAKEIALTESAMGSVLRTRFLQEDIGSIERVYEIENRLRERLKVQSLGMIAETAVIAKCSEVLSRTHAGGDDLMLQKVKHLQAVIETSIANDDSDAVDSAYMMALIKGYGVLGRFAEMKKSFDMLRDAGLLKDHRLYDEVLKWYAYSYNLKEVIAFKDEMTEKGIYHTPHTYFNVFKVLDKYYPRMVEKYLVEMQSKGIHIESFMYPTLIRVFAELQNTEAVEKLYREAKQKASAGGKLNPGVIIQMLKAFQTNAKRCEAIIHDAEVYGLLSVESVQAEIIELYSINDRYSDLKQFLARVPYKSQNMYRVLLRDASKRKDRAAFHGLLQEMRDGHVELNERLFSVIIMALSRFEDSEGVRKFIHEALESDKIHSPLFFSDAAAAYMRLGDTAAVDQCWKDLVQSQMVITMPVYNRFLDLYLSQNNMTMVQEILDTMMKLVPPNPVTATTVVDMLGKMGRLSEMEAVLEEMSKSMNAAPTLVTYHQAMNAYAKCGDVDKMEEMRDRLVRSGFQENPVTYNIMFDGYGRAKRYERLAELIEERKEKNIPLEEFGYVVLLNIYSRAKLREETEALVSDMLESGVPLSSRMLATIASSFSAVGNIAQMEHYVALLLAHPECRLRDVESVFLVYSRLRDIVKLQELLDTEKLPKSEFIYNVCVAAFAKAGEHTKVAFLLTQMEKKGYTLSRNTSITLSSLLLKAGKLELAQTVLKWKGMNPSDVEGHTEGAEEETHPAAEVDEPLKEQLQREVRSIGKAGVTAEEGEESDEETHRM
ncbi:hypothetical protein STCU_07029 [Strigomonas culicis]|uniref:Pentacotripeptide-repeat region of PRORP domain-containing protein n=1 Tax=Strigomonas culicis TaxID=28005 RepID=S9U7G0_9TRYP|nr:hypothetical protein STCU_09081 [Strigomonas culicis]EPY24739.1 hypothetical protein STCU_07029 [Strigomonas culicis]|eukprot:EPY20260.1 hypothetical protein STCU_09081 [Strigomonas culicis]